jgi:hypothetical protein
MVAGREGSLLKALENRFNVSIHLPDQLVGVHNVAPPGSNQGVGYHHRALPPSPTPSHISITSSYSSRRVVTPVMSRFGNSVDRLPAHDFRGLYISGPTWYHGPQPPLDGPHNPASYSQPSQHHPIGHWPQHPLSEAYHGIQHGFHHGLPFMHGPFPISSLPVFEQVPITPTLPGRQSNASQVLEVQPVNHFAGPHPGLRVHNGEYGQSFEQASLVSIIGEPPRIRLAIATLEAQARRTKVVSLDVVIPSQRLDRLLKQHLGDIRAIVRANASYVQVPSVGSGHSLFTIFGENHTDVHRSMRQIMALASQVYEASIALASPGSYAEVDALVHEVVLASGVEIRYTAKSLVMIGLYQEVRKACLILLEDPKVDAPTLCVTFSFVSSKRDRTFISGKKAGKFRSIEKATGVKVHDWTLGQFTCIVALSGPGHAAVKGLELLVGELPAEISFFIPLRHHQRIIGKGGQTVKEIRSLYGVYIHCASAEEHAHLGGYIRRSDNTLIQCPAKNMANLEPAKQAVLQIVATPAEVESVPQGPHTVDKEATPKRASDQAGHNLCESPLVICESPELQPPLTVACDGQAEQRKRQQDLPAEYTGGDSPLTLDRWDEDSQSRARLLARTSRCRTLSYNAVAQQMIRPFLDDTVGRERSAEPLAPSLPITPQPRISTSRPGTLTPRPRNLMGTGSQNR